MSVVRVATRGSDLALAQAQTIAGRIRNELGRETELVVLTTSGDRMQDVSLAKIGGKGLFVKEIEQALLDGEADVAVHSAKDLPSELAPGLALAAFPERQDPRDALVGRQAGAQLRTLREGARVGTGSSRRIAALKALRPDLDVVPLRGNVPTRIAKLETEDLDAVVLASAGLDRLALSARISERIDTDAMLPAPCQGTLALEVRVGDSLGGLIAGLGDPIVDRCTRAERSFLRHLEGDCTVPLAAHAEVVADQTMRLQGWVASRDGTRFARGSGEGDSGDCEKLGREVAERVLADGGSDILDELRREAAG